MGYLIKSEVLDAIHEDLCTSLACYDDFKTKNIVEFCYQSMEREIDNLKQYRLDTVEDQETVNRWIPCNERLPQSAETGEIILHTNVEGEVDICCLDWFYDNIENMVAWQPLPEPYRPE